MLPLDEVPIIPLTLEDAIIYLRGTMIEEERDAFGQLDHDEALVVEHDGGGRWIRNAFKLWEDGTPLRTWFKESLGVHHPDDMSHLILSALWCAIRSAPRRLDEEIEKVHAYWRAHGPLEE